MARARIVLNEVKSALAFMICIPDGAHGISMLANGIGAQNCQPTFRDLLRVRSNVGGAPIGTCHARDHCQRRLPHCFSLLRAPSDVTFHASRVSMRAAPWRGARPDSSPLFTVFYFFIFSCKQWQTQKHFLHQQLWLGFFQGQLKVKSRKICFICKQNSCL